MEDHKNLWNTKVTDMTVGDSVVVSVVAPVAVLASTMLIGVVAGTFSAVTRKFRKGNEAPQNETGE